LQQRAAGGAPLDGAAGGCVLIDVGATQARTRLEERQRVSPAAEVRDGCHMIPSYVCESVSCFTAAFLLSHYKFFAPAFTPAVLTYICYFYFSCCVCVCVSSVCIIRVIPHKCGSCGYTRLVHNISHIM
jgi:hypothetical protein